MVYTLVFRIRREYFDAIAKGDKTTEYRAATEFWDVRWRNAERHLKYNRPVRALFICGKETMERYLSHLTMHLNAYHALGRHPSAQGQKDLGDGPVYGFHLKKDERT